MFCTSCGFLLFYFEEKIKINFVFLKLHFNFYVKKNRYEERGEDANARNKSYYNINASLSSPLSCLLFFNFLTFVKWNHPIFLSLSTFFPVNVFLHATHYFATIKTTTQHFRAESRGTESRGIFLFVK